MKYKHTLRCTKKHLYSHGQYLLNQKKDASQYQKGVGDGLLRAWDLLNGRIIGDVTLIYKDRCICKPKRIAKYDHYEKESS